MKIIINPQKYAIYAFIFSLNFETMNLFNLGIDYLASKITISILLIISLLNYKSTFSLNHFSKYLIPILIYFVLLTVISFANKSSSSQVFFDFPFFLNIVIFLILINYSIIKPDFLLKGLFVFTLSTFILSLLYFFGIAVTDPLEGRFTVFGMNQNMLGLGICISLFVLTSIIFENRLEYGKNRYFLLLLFPLLFGFLMSTGSRVAFISLVFGAFLFLYFNKLIAPIKKTLTILAALLTFILFWFIFLKNSLVSDRLLDSVNNGDLSSRDLIWFKLYDIIANNFLCGLGKTGYIKEMANLFGEGSGSASPHNVILEVLCYTGIIGLLVFLFFFMRIFKNALMKIKYNGELLPIVIIIPILGLILSGQIFEIKLPWVIFAYIVSISVTKNETKNLSV